MPLLTPVCTRAAVALQCKMCVTSWALCDAQIELVILIGAYAPLGSLSKGMDEKKCIRAVGLGLDLTRRSKQTELKSAGLPWTVSKSFAGSALLSPMTAYNERVPLDQISFALQVDSQEITSKA